MDKEVDEFTSCPVCFEDYEERGDHVPRLLPCSHTLCDKCVRELKQGNRLRCPQDRLTHKASRKFPQNNYILNQIRGEKERLYKKCENHGREINLFCRNQACQQELCSLCLTENHKKHDVEDLLSIKEVKLAEIAKGIEKEEERFKDYNNKLNIIREEADEELSKTLTEVNTKNEECLVLLDERLAQVYNVTSTMTNIKENLNMESTYADMSFSQATIRNETANLTKIFERPVPIFQFNSTREDKCVGHSFETNYPQQSECPKVDRPSVVKEGILSLKKETARSMFGFLFTAIFLVLLTSFFTSMALMNFPEYGQRLLPPIRVSSQAHFIIQTDVPTCRYIIEGSLTALMTTCLSTIFPLVKTTSKIGEDPLIFVYYRTGRFDESDTIEQFTAECSIWTNSCTLNGKDSGVSIGITWDLDEYSEDRQQTKFSTTVKCTAEFSFCEVHENSLYTIHDIFFNLVKNKLR